MKKFLKKIWDGIKNLWNKVVDKTRDMVPVAINVVEAIKAITDSPVDDVLAEIIKRAIPGTADDIIVDKIKRTIEDWVPRILTQLVIIDGIANIDDPNEQLQEILKRLKLAEDETKNIVYHGLASLILEKLSDEELSWSDAAAISEYYYQNFVKPQKALQ